jgi:uncharacterized protein
MASDPEHVPAPPPPALAPHPVRFPVNAHHWDNISFLHWPVDPGEVQRLLPDGLRVLTRESVAWVGLTPFFIRVRPFDVPWVPPRHSFPETNLRTYVRGPDGRQGIWFLRMEVTARWFVVMLRALGLPYVRQDMTVDRGNEAVTYRSEPHGPGGSGGHDVTVRPGTALDPPHGGEFERFLTARWDAYHLVGPQMFRTHVWHPPWELRTAIVDRCEVGSLFSAADLNSPTAAPLAHYSDGVVVRVGTPVPVRAGRAEADRERPRNEQPALRTDG